MKIKDKFRAGLGIIVIFLVSSGVVFISELPNGLPFIDCMGAVAIMFLFVALIVGLIKYLVWCFRL